MKKSIIRRRIHYVFIFCCCLVWSCDFNIFPPDVRYEYYTDELVKSSQELDADGERHGEYYGYYISGQVRIKIEYVKGKKHGLEIGYYENGPIYCEIKYSNGDKSGESSWYYESGELKSLVKYKSNLKKTGTSYSKDGRIEAFVRYNDAEEVIYRAEYDEDNNIKETGSKLVTTIYNTDSLLIGEQFDAEIYYTCPPNYRCEFDITLTDNAKSDVEIKSLLPDNENFYKISNSWKSTGDYCYSLNYRFSSEINHVESDTLSNTLCVTVFED